MNYILLSLVTLVSQVDATLLDGTKIQGSLKSLSGEQALFVLDGKEQTVPVSQLMEVSFSGSDEKNNDEKAFQTIELIDQSVFRCDEIQIDSEVASINSPLINQINIPLKSIANIRLGDGNSEILNSWNELCSRKNKQDLLVIKKGNVLDHLGGTITAITKERVLFLLDGTEIKASRTKIFGLIYATQSIPDSDAQCKLQFKDKSLINLSSISQNVDESLFQAELLVGGNIQIPVAQVERIDFSLGKVQYLSDMKPAEVVYTPFFDVEWKFQKNRNMDGGPIRLGRKKYENGLCIHSKTYLRYRLPGDYSRFKAIMGIDDSVNKLGHVHIVLSADGKILLETDVSGEDAPKELDLEIKGARELEILVDFGSNLDISDHLDLANARLVK